MTSVTSYWVLRRGGLRGPAYVTTETGDLIAETEVVITDAGDRDQSCQGGDAADCLSVDIPKPGIDP